MATTVGHLDLDIEAFGISQEPQGTGAFPLLSPSSETGHLLRIGHLSRMGYLLRITLSVEDHLVPVNSLDSPFTSGWV